MSQIVDHYCAPVNIGNYHWVVLDVIMPYKDLVNCGVWALMEMCNRKCGFNEQIGTRTIADLKQY